MMMRTCFDTSSAMSFLLRPLRNSANCSPTCWLSALVRRPGSLRGAPCCVVGCEDEPANYSPKFKTRFPGMCNWSPPKLGFWPVAALFTVTSLSHNTEEWQVRVEVYFHAQRRSLGVGVSRQDSASLVLWVDNMPVSGQTFGICVLFIVLISKIITFNFSKRSHHFSTEHAKVFCMHTQFTETEIMYNNNHLATKTLQICKQFAELTPCDRYVIDHWKTLIITKL